MSTEEVQISNEDKIIEKLLDGQDDDFQQADFEIKELYGYIKPIFKEGKVFYSNQKTIEDFPMMLSIWSDSSHKVFQKNIVNKSAQEMFFPEIQRIYDWLEEIPAPEDELHDDVNYNISRPLQGLASSVEMFMDNYNEYVNPPIPKKKRTARLLKEKQSHFLTSGYKHMILMIVNHINTLTEADFPPKMFGRYKEYADLALNNDRGLDYSLEMGLKLALCAEIVLPVSEDLQPRKRVTEAISVGV